jgi:hypothetical protein
LELVKGAWIALLKGGRGRGDEISQSDMDRPPNLEVSSVISFQHFSPPGT